MSSAGGLERYSNPISLKNGSGCWCVFLGAKSKLKDLESKAQEIIDFASCPNRWRDNATPSVLEHQFGEFHIRIAQKVAEYPDQVQFHISEFVNPESFEISTHPDIIASYAQAYIEGSGSPVSSSHRDKKFVHLVDRAAKSGRAAHFAVVVSFPSDAGVLFALARSPFTARWPESVPTSGLDLPEGVEGFWVISPDFTKAVGYLKNMGWLRFPD